MSVYTRFLFTSLLLLGCGPKNPAAPSVNPVTVNEPQPRPKAEPLPTPTLKTPELEVRTLSNGIQVIVATQSEVPLWDVRIAFAGGGYLDPDDKLGLAEITFSMLTKGAGKKSAEEISRTLKQMASSVSASASPDGASLRASGIKRNLEPTLDIWANVLRSPTFPQAEWDIEKPQWLAKIVNARKDPSSIARRVYNRVLYQDTYRGRLPMETDYKRITPKDMKTFYRKWVGPENAIIIAGGDITADELVPLLESKIGSWNPRRIEKPEVTVVSALPKTPAIVFVDSPGAAQSVIRPMTIIGDRTAEDYFHYRMGLDVVGGTFMSRVNMNLREDKGYTYGARCFSVFRHGPSIGMCNTQVQTKVTLPAFQELQKELKDMVSTRPATEKELAYFQASAINKYPAQFETTATVLNEQVNIWRYGLPDDWPSRFLPGVESTTLEQANSAFSKYWSPERTIWLVVGDKATIWSELQATGLEIREIDADGNPTGEAE